MGTDMCLPVARYSHAVGLRADNTVPWTHITSSTLFIIVKGTDSSVKEDEKLMLRIVQGNDVLESVDVGSYVDSALRARRIVRSTDPPLRLEQLPIFGMTKDAIVALRYTLNDGQARRIQMRMHSAAECRQIVHALERRGLDIMEQRPGTARPSTARPLTMTSHLATPQPSSPYFHGSQQPARHPFTSQVVEAGSLSQIRPAYPGRFEGEPGGSSQLQHASSQEMRLSNPITRDETLAPREVAPNRPSTSQIYRSHTMQPQPSPFDAHDIIHQAQKSGLARPSSTSNTAAADAINQAVEQYESPPHSAVANQLSFPTLDAPDRTETMNPAVAAADKGLPSHDTARPTTGSSFVFPETLEHEIPPRRELPFARPDSRRSGSGTANSRPRSALTLPPLPKPRLSPQNSSSGANMAPPTSRPLSPTRPQTSSPLKRSYAEMSDSTTAAGRPSTASPIKSASPSRIPSPQAPAKKPSRMEELLRGRKASLEKPSTSKAQRTDSLADAPGEEDESFMSNDPSPGKASVPRDSMSPVRRVAPGSDSITNAYAAISSAGQRDTSLRQYAEQSLEDRQAALDEFMVANLENPDFTTLCKDVENCWRRIALGL